MPGMAFFRCERMRATLSTTACQAMWRKADACDDGAHAACRLCPVGAVHAGEVAASMSPLKGAMICSRCHRTATRMIGGNHCPSCYNRQREVIAGRNAKGGAPVKLQSLHARVLRCRQGAEIRRVRGGYTLDTTELLVAVLRDSRQRVVFAFNCTPPAAIKQARLW